MMNKKKLLILSVIVIFVLLLALKIPVLADYSANLQISSSAPPEVNVCDSNEYIINITNIGTDPAYNILANVTMPNGFSNDTSTVNITFPGGSSTQEPVMHGRYLEWNLSAIINASRHVFINEFEQNPPGDDGGNEWVELYNPTSSAVNIGGWRLVNGDGGQYTIPASTIIPPEGFWTHTFPSQWLNQTNENVTLYNGSFIVDKTPTKNDEANDDRSWARYPNGYDTDTDSDWNFQTSTKNSSNGGTSGDLNPGDKITIRFNMTAGCNVLSGQRVIATVAYDGGSSTGLSSSILVNKGHLEILKTPSVVEAGKLDIVNWTITIENTGSGPVYNVRINDTLSSGLQLVNITSQNGEMNWSYSRIEAGESKIVNISARVIACVDLYNLVNGSWDCNGVPCQVPEPYAKGSVKFIHKEPRLDYTITPEPISVPYCGNASVNITFTNTGPGNASNLRLELISMPSQYQITNVSGAVYNASNNTFIIGTVEHDSSRSVTFNFGMKHGACDAGSGVMALKPIYEDECEHVWAPPTRLLSYSLNSSTLPGISVSKSGPNELYLGETGTYNLSVTYTNGSCPEASVTTNIIDTYPANFNVTNASGGTVNTSAHTITWANQVLQHGVAWNRTIHLQASEDPCDCGNVYTNTLTIEQKTDCCGCNLSGSASLAILVECYNESIFTSSKNAAPNPQENCRNITYTTFYNFTNVGAINWSDINFTEQGGNVQTFPDGSAIGTATFIVNGTCVQKRDITIGSPINLGFLNGTCGPLTNGTTLIINYTLYQWNTGTFVDWSDLNITGFSSDCVADTSFHEGVRVTVGRSDFSIGMSYPNKLDTCGVYNFTITLSKNGPWNGYEMNITYDDTDFRYLGPANISGITNESGPVPSFEPDRTGNNLTWYIGNNVSSGGTIRFKVEKTCSQNKSIRALLKYRDNCGNPLNDSFAGAPLLLDKGDIIIDKTPEVIYALERNVSWKIYVTNKGSGTAYNVSVVDTLDTDLSYLSSSIDGSEDPANTTNTTVNGFDTITWKLHNMTPNQQRIIELNATLIGCENRNNSVFTMWGCGGEECQNVSDTSKVELPPTWILVAKHEADLVDECGANASFLIKVKNIGKTYAYTINISEFLPNGLQYVPGSANVTGATPSATNLSGNPLTWTFDQWAPGTVVTITFNATVKGHCDFTGNNSKVTVNYTKPCGEYGTEVESDISVYRANPLLSITKTPSLTIAENTSTVNWTITIRSTGDYEAKNITLKDMLPSNTEYFWSNPEKISGTGTAGDPLVWNLPNMSVGNTTTVNLSARVISCTANLTENNATVFWGCCPTALSSSTAIARLRTSPVIELSKAYDYIDTCGGNYTITIRNTGSNASVVTVTDVLPVNFVYKFNSSTISSSNTSRTFTNEEPLDYSSIKRTIIWNATNIDMIYTNEEISVTFGIENAPGNCTSAFFSPSFNNVSLNYTDSCGNYYGKNISQAITPKLANLSILKEPETQPVGAARWTIYVSNTGTGTAYNVTVIDVLGNGFTNVAVVEGDGTVTSNQPSFGWTTINWSGLTITVGEVWTRNITANAQSMGDLTNNVTVQGICPTGCIYSQHSDLAYAARINATKEPDTTQTIGEYANFTITAEFWGSNDWYNDTMINDTLPIGLVYHNWTCAFDDGNSCGTLSITPSGGNTILSWDLGNFTGARTVKINLTTIVNDTISNQDGATIINRVDVYHKNENGTLFQAYDIANVTLVEPDLIIVKSTNKTVVVAGDAITYTIKAYHTNQSTHDAYDIWINDTVPDKLEILSNTSTPAANQTIQIGNNLRWFYSYVPLSYNYSNPINITYVVRVNDSVIIGEILRNNATLTWTSVNETTGNESYERYGGWTDLDDYNRTDVEPLTINTSVSMEKLPTETSYRTIGEGVNFTIKVYLPKTLVLDVWVNDTLSTGLIYDNGSFNLVANNDTFQELISGPNNGSQPTTVSWYLGTVNNTDGTNITINFTAIVADVLFNQNGTKLNNTATFSWKYANGTRDAKSDTSGDIIVLEPEIQIIKQFNVSKVEAGDVINFTIIVNHTASSAWDAFDLWINDTIPDKLEPISCSPNPTADHSWYYARLNRSNNINITCTVRVKETVELNETLKNTVNLTWTSTNGTNPYERFGNWTTLDDYNRTASAIVTANTTFSISKKVDRINATIGEYVNYTLQVNLSRGHALNLTVKDTLQKGLIYYANTTSVIPDNFTVSSPNNGSQNVTVNFVYNDFNNSAGNNLTIILTAIVADMQGNQNGTQLNDTLNVSWKDATNDTRKNETTVSIALFEPDLMITKQFNVSRVEAGDVINFTILVNHTAASAWDAYDLWINDTIPAKLDPISCSPTPAPDQTIDHSWYYSRLNRSNNITITCTVRVKETVELNETLKNTVNLTWTSTNGTNPYERFGNGTALDDYNRTALVNVSARDTISIAKSVNKLNATIGEYLDYTIRVGLPKVNVNNVTINDTLPSDLAYDRFISLDANGNNETFAEVIDGQNISWYLGDVNNSDGRNITIVFRAVVRDILANQNGEYVENNRVIFRGYDVNNNTYTRSNQSDSVRIVEPDLFIEKSVNNSIVEAGDVVIYTINVAHTAQSTADAYDVWVNDTLPDHLAFLVEISTGTFTQAGQNLNWFYLYIPLTNTSANPVTITYTARVTGEVIANETLRNLVNLTWTSVNETIGNESHERFGNHTQLDDYNATNSTVLTGASNWTLNKTLDKATATIGESVNYTVLVGLSKVHVLNLTVKDILQQGLIYHDHTPSVAPDNFTVSTPNNGTQPVTVTFLYNDFNNSLGTNLTINLTALMANVQDNQNGTRLNNTLNVSWTDAQDVKYTNETNVSITVAEPDLAINKTTNVSHVHVEAGDLIAFNITINHTQNSTADAYDIWVNDTIPIRTELVDNSSNPPADTFIHVGRNVSWFYEYVPLGQIINITYTVRVNESVSPLDILINNVTLTWTSVNETVGNESHERFGGWNTLNDYNESDSQQVIVLAAELYKAPDFNRSYWINDSVWYRISLVLPYATVLNATVNDTLPQGLIFENTSVKVVPNHTFNLSFSEPNDGTQPVNITFDFGTLQDGKIINITFNATVADIPANQNGTILDQNFAELFWNDNEGTLHNSSDTSGNIIVIRLPRITTTDGVIKIVEPDYVLPGAIVNYTVYIKNDGFAPAFNVTLADILPQYVGYINTTTIVQGLPGPDPDDITPYGNRTKLTWTNLIARLNASETIWVQYSCWVSPNAPFGAVLINNATVEKFEDDEGNEYKGASDSAILKIKVNIPVLNNFGLSILTGLLMVIALFKIRRGGLGIKKSH